MTKILVAIVAIAIAGVWWLYPRRSAEPSGAKTTAGSAQAWEPGQSITSATAPPPSPHVRQVASAERQQLAERIAAAQALRAKRKQATPTSSGPQADQGLASSGSAHGGDMDKEVIRGAMHEVLPFLADCYDEARPTLGADHLSIHAKFQLTGDRDIGTVIDAQQLIDDDGHVLATKLDDCLRGTLQTLELPPLGDGETIEVNYPLVFADGSDGSGSGA